MKQWLGVLPTFRGGQRLIAHRNDESRDYSPSRTFTLNSNSTLLCIDSMPGGYPTIDGIVAMSYFNIGFHEFVLTDENCYCFVMPVRALSKFAE